MNLEQIDQDFLATMDKAFWKYDYALKVLETQLEILIQEFEHDNGYNPVEHIKTRRKTKDSIIKKMKRKGYELTLENMENHIHDITGIRLVCSFIADVYSIVDLIQSNDQIIIKELKDYIESPKESGYRSYHVIVSVPVHLKNYTQYVDAEIQVRTVAMDFWASLDHKIQYKFESQIPSIIKQKLYDCSLDIKKLDQQMYHLNKIVMEERKNQQDSPI